jgi:transposase
LTDLEREPAEHNEIGGRGETKIYIDAISNAFQRFATFDGLAALVQGTLAENPFSGHVFVFRGRAGDRVKVLWWDGTGLCLFAKRLERGRFVWPQQATNGVVALEPGRMPAVGVPRRSTA